MPARQRLADLQLCLDYFVAAALRSSSGGLLPEAGRD